MAGPEAAAFKADLRALLVALIKVALADTAPQAADWREEAIAAQGRAAQAREAAGGLRLDDLWTAAVKAAEGDPVVQRDETVNPTLPTVCPLETEALLKEPFALDEAVATIRNTASFG